MKHNHKSRARLKRIEPEPLPESLEMAFQAIERPAPRYADATPERTESIAAAPRTAHNAR